MCQHQPSPGRCTYGANSGLSTTPNEWERIGENMLCTFLHSLWEGGVQLRIIAIHSWGRELTCETIPISIGTWPATPATFGVVLNIFSMYGRVKERNAKHLFPWLMRQGCVNLIF